MKFTGIAVAAGLGLALAGFANPAAATGFGVSVQTKSLGFPYGGYPYYGPYYGAPYYRFRYHPHYGDYDHYGRPRQRRHYHFRYSEFHRPHRHLRAAPDGRCGFWHRRCTAYWGYGSSNYFICLRHYHCR